MRLKTQHFSTLILKLTLKQQQVRAASHMTQRAHRRAAVLAGEACTAPPPLPGAHKCRGHRRTHTTQALGQQGMVVGTLRHTCGGQRVERVGWRAVVLVWRVSRRRGGRSAHSRKQCCPVHNGDSHATRCAHCTPSNTCTTACCDTAAGRPQRCSRGRRALLRTGSRQQFGTSASSAAIRSDHTPG